MSLKAGHVNDFSGSLAKAMEVAMAQEWQAVKGSPMPGTDPQDRHILFVGIARGLLGYLEAHQNDMIKSMTMDFGAGDRGATIKAVDLDVAL
jgi:hypothetical protein